MWVLNTYDGVVYQSEDFNGNEACVEYAKLVAKGVPCQLMYMGEAVAEFEGKEESVEV